MLKSYTARTYCVALKAPLLCQLSIYRTYVPCWCRSLSVQDRSKSMSERTTSTSGGDVSNERRNWRRRAPVRTFSSFSHTSATSWRVKRDRSTWMKHAKATYASAGHTILSILLTFVFWAHVTLKLITHSKFTRFTSPITRTHRHTLMAVMSAPRKRITHDRAYLRWADKVVRSEVVEVENQNRQNRVRATLLRPSRRWALSTVEFTSPWRAVLFVAIVRECIHLETKRLHNKHKHHVKLRRYPTQLLLISQKHNDKSSCPLQFVYFTEEVFVARVTPLFPADSGTLRI